MATVQMRAILLAWCVAFAAAASARTILVPTQPVSPFADTEVSTNIALHASRTDTREFGVRIQLAGTPTNNLEVAFGGGGRDGLRLARRAVLRRERPRLGADRNRSRRERHVRGRRHPAAQRRADCAEAFHGHLRGRGGVPGAGDDTTPVLALPRGVGHGSRDPSRRGRPFGMGALRHRVRIIRNKAQVTLC